MDRIRDKVQCNPTVKLTKGEMYPFVGIDRITSGNRDIAIADKEVYSGQSCSKFRKGDTIMARITPCLENGKIAQYNLDSEIAMGSTELFVFREIENISDKDYIYYLISTDYVRNNAVNSMTGASGRQRADIKFIGKLKWNFPEYDVQCKIGKILSTYDDLIEKNNRKIEILQDMAEELYKEWFVRFRFPGYKTAKFTDGIPDGWEYKPFSKIATFERGVSYSSDEIDCEDGINLINLKNINSYGGFRLGGTKKYNGKYRDGQVVKCGDLIMGVTDMTQDRRTVGAVALIPHFDNTCVISADLVKLNSDIDNLFIYSLCRYGYYSKFFSQFANGSNVLHLKPSSLRNQKMLIPREDLI